MEHYKLGADEVVLFEDTVKLVSEKKAVTDLVLTNHNIVFINRIQKIFSQDEVSVEVYPISDIKVYKGEPQVKVKSNHNLMIYLIPDEKEIIFDSKNHMNKFVTAVIDLLTDTTKTERVAEKLKNTIGLVDDTLGIDSVNLAGKTIKDGVTGKLTGLAGKMITGIFKKKK